MQIVGPVNSAEWGSYRRLTAQDRDEQREALFPWASSDDTLSEPGALTGAELRALARRRFRSTTRDADAALDDGLAALRALNDLLEVHAGSASQGMVRNSPPPASTARRAPPAMGPRPRS